MSNHRFINDGRSPIPMGAAAEYGCVCGKRGTHEAIAFHIAEMLDRADQGNRTVQPIDDFLGGDTQANYLPHPPRKPAPTGESLPLRRPDTPEPLPPPPTSAAEAWPESASAISIAELFQSMLRLAFQAGGAAAASGESFETWYQREVLR